MAATATGDKQQRIVEAMRASVARRGVAGSTFDHVAQEAGVSRGLLHYYFGTKERLLVEVVRRDSEERMSVLVAQLHGAATADDVVALLAHGLERAVRDEPESIVLTFELFALGRRHPEVADELARLAASMRAHVAELLAVKEAEDVLHLRAAPDAVAEVLFSLADGLALRMVSEPDRDFGPTVRAAVAAVRALVDDRC
jgi:AcrR family transcriptional regulator